MDDLTFKTAVSLKGHDTKRRYVIVSTVNEDFVLAADGKYRKLDKPKLKRLKHLRIDGDSGLNEKSITDEKLKECLKKSNL